MIENILIFEIFIFISKVLVLMLASMQVAFKSYGYATFSLGLFLLLLNN